MLSGFSQKSNYPDNEAIVVCVLGEKILVKKFFQQDGKITLFSINGEKYPPILVTKDDYFKVEGIVRNIIKFN